MVQDDEPVGLDGLQVEFDDEGSSATRGDARATLAARLGIEALAGQLVRLRGDRTRGANSGRRGHPLGDLPARWPWHGDYINALNRIRALPAAA